MDDRDRELLEQIRSHGDQAMSWAREAGVDWTSDAKTLAAVAHLVGQIGELARRVSTPTKVEHADIPWARIAAMRNRIYHDYLGLDRKIIRDTVADELPRFARRLRQLLRKPDARAGS